MTEPGQGSLLEADEGYSVRAGHDQDPYVVVVGMREEKEADTADRRLVVVRKSPELYAELLDHDVSYAGSIVARAGQWLIDLPSGKGSTLYSQEEFDQEFTVIRTAYEGGEDPRRQRRAKALNL